MVWQVLTVNCAAHNAPVEQPLPVHPVVILAERGRNVAARVLQQDLRAPGVVREVRRQVEDESVEHDPKVPGRAVPRNSASGDVCERRPARLNSLLVRHPFRQRGRHRPEMEIFINFQAFQARRADLWHKERQFQNAAASIKRSAVVKCA